MKSHQHALTLFLAALTLPLPAAPQQDAFSVTVPPGWKTESANGRILVSLSPSQFVSIEPIPNPRDLPPAQLLQSLAKTGSIGVLRGATATLARNADPNLATAKLTTGTIEAHALVAAGGSIATLMIAAAPNAVFEQQLPAMIEILRSFRFRPPQSTAAPQPAISFQRVSDGREQAFSTELPAGWQNEVGTYRPTVGDYRFETRTQSPDGAIFAFAGDRNIGKFITPSPRMAQFGVREGGTYNPSGSVIYAVLRYLPGMDFARYYVERRFPGARIVKFQALPQMADQTARLRYRYGNPNQARVDAGELEFEYQGKQGYVVAITELTGGQMGVSYWNPINLTGYLASPGKAAAAASVARHIVESGLPNREWVMREYRMQAVEAKQGMDAMQSINNVWTKTLQERSDSNARNSRLAGDNLSGQYRMQDPTTGQQIDVQAQSNYFYRVNNTNTVIGTQHELPATTPIDVTRLLRIDVDIRPR